jgi:hypothetical protein
MVLLDLNIIIIPPEQIALVNGSTLASTRLFDDRCLPGLRSKHQTIPFDAINILAFGSLIECITVRRKRCSRLILLSKNAYETSGILYKSIMGKLQRTKIDESRHLTRCSLISDGIKANTVNENTFRYDILLKRKLRNRYSNDEKGDGTGKNKSSTDPRGCTMNVPHKKLYSIPSDLDLLLARSSGLSDNNEASRYQMQLKNTLIKCQFLAGNVTRKNVQQIMVKDFLLRFISLSVVGKYAHGSRSLMLFRFDFN